MIPIHLKSAFRQLWKNKLFRMVNIIGLSVGFASVMALLIGIYMDITSGDMHRDMCSINYLKPINASGNDFVQTTYPLLDEIIKTCPEAEVGFPYTELEQPMVEIRRKRGIGQHHEC